jgi:DNA-binding transcriptional LysR family regulator
MLEIRQLQYFLAVVHEMHFTKAAERLHVAQPALSKSVQQMESTLGAQLFIRHPNKEISLTPLGKIFYIEAKRTIEQVERSRIVLRRAVLGKVQSLSLGYTITTILGPLSGLVASFHAKYPQVELRTLALPIHLLLEKLHDGELDLICADSGVIDAELESAPLPPLPMAVALHCSHRLAAERGDIALTDLAEEVFILPTPHKVYELYNLFRSFCLNAGFDPNCQYYADSALEGIGLVAANLGVDLVHELPLILCVDQVVVRRIAPLIPLHMYLIWRRGDVPEYAAHFLALRPDCN